MSIIDTMKFDIIATYAMTLICSLFLGGISRLLGLGDGFSFFLLLTSFFWVYWLVENLQDYEKKEPIERYPF